jgi:iron(III) transport system substrate-binding protein
MITTRARIAAILTVVALAGLGGAPAAAQSAREKQLYEAAKQEREFTWYTAHYDQALATRIGNAFTQKYPGVQANVIKATAQVTFQRLLQDIKAGQIQSDVFSSTDISHFVQLKQGGNLETYVPENESKIVEAFRKIDPDGLYTVTWVGLVAISYNTAKVKAADAPKSWTELLDPKWTGQIATGNPNYSGSVGVWTVALAKLYGWDWFTKLNALKPLVGRSIDDGVTVLNAAERTLAIADPATTLRSAAKGNPLAVSFPTDGAVAVIGPTGIIKGAKSPNAAKLFLEFLLSPEGVKLIAENYEQSLRPDVPPPAGAKALAEVKTVRPTAEDIVKDLPGEKEKWKDTFGM